MGKYLSEDLGISDARNMQIAKETSILLRKVMFFPDYDMDDALIELSTKFSGKELAYAAFMLNMNSEHARRGQRGMVGRVVDSIFFGRYTRSMGETFNPLTGQRSDE
jgi:hypothetical protein